VPGEQGAAVAADRGASAGEDALAPAGGGDRAVETLVERCLVGETRAEVGDRVEAGDRGDRDEQPETRNEHRTSEREPYGPL
jgi:hypothetical protein